MENFSVLMSVYNKENAEFFDISLDSILVSQTCCPDEFVLVCDGELNLELEAVIEKYEKLCSSVMKVYRKEHGGLGKALNFGLLKCSNPLVARADSDDVCAPDRFEKQLRYLEEHPEIGIVGSFIGEFDTDWKHPNRTKTLPLSHEELKEMAKLRNPLNHMTVMMRRDEILRIGSYNNIPYTEDYELWVRALVNGVRIANVGEVLVHARIGNGMVRRRGTRKYIRGWHVINRYMVKHGMTNNLTYVRNMVAIIGFVFMPSSLREFVYNNILRKK